MTKTQMTKVAEHIVNYYGDGFLEDFKTYLEARKAVENGEFLIYYDDQRDFLADLYNNTEEQKNKYTDEQVFKRYREVIASMVYKEKYINEAIKNANK